MSPALTFYPTAFNASACSRNTCRSSRSICRALPLSAFRATFALPSSDFGPVLFSHGFQRRINSARSALCSGVLT